MRMHCSITAILYGLLLLNPVAPAHAQSNKPDNTSSPGPCSGAEYRQFDFWIGDWEVQLPDGKPAGTNRISRILDGCVIQVHQLWESSRDGGESWTVVFDGRYLRRDRNQRPIPPSNR